MSYLKYFLDEGKPIVKRQFVAVEDDWNFIQSVFPEPGFRSYVLGHVVSKIAKALKENGIHSFNDRQQRPELTSITRVLSGIQVTWSAGDTNVGRGVSGARDEDAHRTGDPASSTRLADCKAEEDSSQGRS